MTKLTEYAVTPVHMLCVERPRDPRDHLAPQLRPARQLISTEFTGGPTAWDASAAEGRSNDTVRNVTVGGPCFPVLFGGDPHQLMPWPDRSVRIRLSGSAFGSVCSRRPNGLTPLK